LPQVPRTGRTIKLPALFPPKTCQGLKIAGAFLQKKPGKRVISSSLSLIISLSESEILPLQGLRLGMPATEQTKLALDKYSSFWVQTRGLTWPFWVVNLMEMIERLAYYGVRVVIPIYIAQADEIGGLHFTMSDKGFIFMWWALVQSALPVFTGGFADRYGYKKQIVVAIVLKGLGYVLMATQREFWPFFSGCLFLAAGTAVFKPPIQGTFVKTLTDSTSGVGWGFFYMVVNIGGFLGPPVAHFLYGYSWPMVFYGCAALVSLNLLWLLTYRAPAQHPAYCLHSHHLGILGSADAALGHAAQFHRGLGGQLLPGPPPTGLYAFPGRHPGAPDRPGVGD
jgi:MFS family permease